MAAKRKGGGWGLPGRALTLVVAPLWLAAISVLAFHQAPAPNPFAPPLFLSFDWWRHPIERHAAARLPLIAGALHGLHVSTDGRAIWAVGSDGLILHSADGGALWVRQDTPGLSPRPRATVGSATWSPLSKAVAAEPPASKEPPQRQQGGSYSQDIIQAPSGGLPELQGDRQPAEAPPVQTQRAPKAQPAPAKGEARPSPKGIPAPQDTPPPPQKAPPTADRPADGSKPAPSQSAIAPTLSTAPARPTLLSVFFLADGQRGWAVGEFGALLITRDGGQHWEHAPAADANLTRTSWVAIAFRESGEGWMVGRDGVVVHRAAGKAQWQEQTRLSVPVTLARIDLEKGWLYCLLADNSIVTVDQNGAAWYEAYRTGQEVDFGGWLVPAEGGRYRLSDGPTAPRGGWRIQSRRTASGALYALIAPASIARIPTGVTAGASFVVQWLTQPPDVMQPTPAPDGTTAVGASGQRYVSRDDGRDWYPEPALYSRYPAPWAWLAWLIGFVALTSAALRPPPAPAARITETIADAFASDKPLAAARDDRLDFAPRAWGLSAFLRNERTEAPLTIAITGDWGSGKSSLMGLLREDLARFGVRSVWFNAWHHQKEEALLAALLSAIRDEAIPGWFSLEGIEYRLRLLWMRGHRYWPLSLAVAFSIGLFGWALTHPGSALDNWFSLTRDIWLTLFGDAQNAPPETETLKRFRAAGLAVGALAPLVTALLRLRAFGVDPGALVASVSKRASIRDLGAQASFRQRFATEFSEVTAALEPRTMLVLIDDLDRCRPEAVLEVMEAVNFLVSSGRVFVVLGMARERVEACVGLAFEKVAQELAESETTRNGSPIEDKEVRARRVRREYAGQYLEKLINIEMPMPQLDPQSSRHLQDDTPRAGDFETPKWLRRLARLWPVLVGIIAVALGAWLGSLLPAAVSHGASTPVAKMVTPAGGLPPVVSGATSEPQGSPLMTRYFASAVDKRSELLRYGAPLSALTLALLVAAVLRRPDPIVRDSPAFRDALAIWNPVVAAALRTPRAVKRYQNWVRYLAMMQRATRRAPTLRDDLGHRFARMLGRQSIATASSTETDSSPELVALGALDRVLPGGVGTDELTSHVGRIERSDIRQAVDAALDAHSTRFDRAALLCFLPRFRQLSRGVRMETPPESPTQAVSSL